MVNRKSSKKYLKKNKKQLGGGFLSTLKTAIVPLFFLGANHKYKKRRKTARKISKKKRKIKNITRKFRRLRRRK
jgi:hypothetical protein